MQRSHDEDPAPRETAAGLMRDWTPPRPTSARTKQADPATQANMVDDRSSPDDYDIRAKSQTGKQVVADKWNQ